MTGLNSYIGDSVTDWLNQWPNDYQVTKWDFKDDTWRTKDFSQFDVVFHVAGIAHNSNDAKLEDLYYKVNTDLTIEIAKKAKNDGVKQFIHMSSIIIYGSKVSKIDETTPYRPDNFYGDSKLQAELGIAPLNSETFKVAIIRPPMIYGKGSKGNYPKLARFAKISPVFPNIKNRRSMLHIENLSELIRLIINKKSDGIYYPQNKEHVSTSDLVNIISKEYGKKIILIKFFNPILNNLNSKIIGKVFGNLYYDKSISSHFNNRYLINDLITSIKKDQSIK